MTIINPFTGSEYAPAEKVFAAQDAASAIAARIGENAAAKEIKLPPDIQPGPGMVLLVRIGDTSGYWSRETGIVKVVDEWKERTSPYAQVVRVGADKEDFGQKAWFAKGDYVLVNHSLLDPVEMEGATFWLAPFSALKAKFVGKIND